MLYYLKFFQADQSRRSLMSEERISKIVNFSQFRKSCTIYFSIYFIALTTVHEVLTYLAVVLEGDQWQTQRD